MNIIVNEIIDKNTLKKQIELFDKEKQVHVLRILKDNNVQFTENKNGIFVNMSEVSDIVIQKIKNYVDYILKQEKLINDKLDNNKNISVTM